MHKQAEDHFPVTIHSVHAWNGVQLMIWQTLYRTPHTGPAQPCTHHILQPHCTTTVVLSGIPNTRSIQWLAIYGLVLSLVIVVALAQLLVESMQAVH